MIEIPFTDETEESSHDQLLNHVRAAMRRNYDEVVESSMIGTDAAMTTAGGGDSGGSAQILIDSLAAMSATYTRESIENHAHLTRIPEALTSYRDHVWAQPQGWHFDTERPAKTSKDVVVKAKAAMESALKVMWENNIEGPVVDELKEAIRECNE